MSTMEEAGTIVEQLVNTNIDVNLNVNVNVEDVSAALSMTAASVAAAASSLTEDAATIIQANTEEIIASATIATSTSSNAMSYGWAAAAFAALCYGSYGVPIKYTTDVDVHPFVLQSYKTCVMFCLAWMVPILGYRIAFTPWGILSGFLWVVGGTGGIIGIRTVGMATAVGTWASTMILVNFSWGILIFQEPVHSFSSTCMSFVLLIIGLVGMSKYSSPTTAKTSRTKDEQDHPLNGKGNSNGTNGIGRIARGLRRKSKSDVVMNGTDMDVGIEMGMNMDSETTADGDTNRGSAMDRMDATLLKSRKKTHLSMLDVMESNDGAGYASNATRNGIEAIGESGFEKNKAHDMTAASPSAAASGKDCGHGGMSKIAMGTSAVITNGASNNKHGASQISINGHHHDTNDKHKDDGSARFFQNKRQIGIFFSVWNGLFGGSALIPLHYAKKHGYGGVQYILSFACGALISNLLLWIIFLTTIYTTQSKPVFPQWHVRRLWKQAVLAGLLLGCGQFSGILATTALGQAVGNSLVQCKILVSGIWGILFFKEIGDPKMIRRWFLSAIICVVAIIWLSCERLLAKT